MTTEEFRPMSILELALAGEEEIGQQIRERLKKRRDSVKRPPVEGWTPWNKRKG